MVSSILSNAQLGTRCVVSNRARFHRARVPAPGLVSFTLNRARLPVSNLWGLSTFLYKINK